MEISMPRRSSGRSLLLALWLLLSIPSAFVRAAEEAENAQEINSSRCGGSSCYFRPPPPTYIQLASPPPPSSELNCPPPPQLQCCQQNNVPPPPLLTSTGLPYNTYTYSAASGRAFGKPVFLGGLVMLFGVLIL